MTPPAALDVTPFVARVVKAAVTQDVSGAVTRTATAEIVSFDGLEYAVEEVGSDQTFGSDDFGDGYFGGYATRVVRGLFMPLITTFVVGTVYAYGRHTRGRVPRCVLRDGCRL